MVKGNRCQLSYNTLPARRNAGETTATYTGDYFGGNTSKEKTLYFWAPCPEGCNTVEEVQAFINAQYPSASLFEVLSFEFSSLFTQAEFAKAPKPEHYTIMVEGDLYMIDGKVVYRRVCFSLTSKLSYWV